MSDSPTPARPDDKDWTWVLNTPCPDCGASVGELRVSEVAEENRANARAWVEVLTGDEDQLRVRPEPDVWSPLEYACHVRDVFKLFLERLDLMLTEENPTFQNWNPNITAEAERYDLANPTIVSAELLEAGNSLADRFGAITADQLGRTGQRSDGAAFTIETFAQYELHDPVHHLWDVTREPSTVGR